ncbi:hypothetical protein BCR35DRAFT_166860 [Leucosporidium creatinivorum]|uniref:FCP1 homology domain-containing protein n=1 Tax=Leucosporidium creatinivorum TaxID=106004 RepID=A0A1Y2EGB4_9BASI|nr:hypothetical protein BCR35DRAFT_166860 [Leucosporidium creatinivorum]
MGRHRHHHRAAAAAADDDDAVSLPSQEKPRWHLHPRPSSEAGFPVAGLFHERPHHRGGRHRSRSHSHSHQERVQAFASADAAPPPSTRAVSVFKSPADFPSSSAGRNELDVIANMPSYLDISNRKASFVPSVPPKSRLLVSDLDNTLFAPAATPTSSVQARPFLKTFIRYITHPGSPYQFAVWTFSGRSFGEAHLRTLGLSKYLFADDNPVLPNEKGLVAAFWGYEDSRISGVEASQKKGPAVKDLDWVSVRRFASASESFK